MAARRGASARDRSDDRVLRLFSSTDVAEVLAEAAALLSHQAKSPLVVVLGRAADGSLLEGWHPGPDVAREPDGVRLRARAFEALTRTEPAPRSTRGRSRVWTLAAAGRTRGAAGLLLSSNARGRGAAFERSLEQAAGVIAEALARCDRATEAAPDAAERERLFKSLERQVRVLDGERQKFAAIVNQSGNYMYVTDPCGVIRWTNRSMGVRWHPAGDGATWVGRTCGEVCSRLTSSPSPCASCPVLRAATQNEVAHHEFRESAQGRVSTLYLTALPIMGLDGQPAEVLVTMQDLSDLETLRESEERYRVITQAASDAIVTIDEGGRIVFANSATERIFGYAQGELLGQPLTSLMPPAPAGPLPDDFCRFLADGDAATSWQGVQAPARHKSGRELTVELSFGEFGTGGRRLFTAVIRDITDRRRAEVELKRAQERLRTVVSNSPIVLFAVDVGGTITLSEGRGLQALGLAPGEIVGRSAFELYAHEPRIVANLKRALAGEGFVDVVELGPLAFETFYTPLRDEGGHVTGLIGVATDVTERRRLEQELLQSQKMEAVGRLAGGIAHDFNNLLTTVLGYSTLLLQKDQGGEDPDRCITEIKRAAERAAALTRQLLAFSRKQVIEPRISDLSRLVADMQEMLRRLIGEDIEMVFDAASEPALVRADPGQLEQLLMNLVVNSRDAMPRGGRIEVGIATLELRSASARGNQIVPPGRYVTLTVRDTGCGMDRATLARVFEPFFTNKERGKGTGLGLAMVYGIVQQSGGHVFVESEVGVGTSFEILLPRAEGSAAPAEETPQTAALPAGAETLLLVEDEAAVRSLLRELLVRQGYHVLEAANGEQALKVAERHAGPIQLLVSDVIMPGMSGGELADKLLRVRPGLRVLYVSGYSDDALVSRGVSREGAAFLQKPFSYETLVAKVREVLDRPGPVPARDDQEREAA